MEKQFRGFWIVSILERWKLCSALSVFILALWCNASLCYADPCPTAVTIAAGAQHSVALKGDGTVVAVGNNGAGQTNVSSWTNIKAVAAGLYHTVGLKEDGTVVAVGLNNHNQTNVSSWTNIKAIGAGYLHTVGLKEDGTVVAVGADPSYIGYYGQTEVSSWTAIKAIAVGDNITVGVKEDGTVVAVGSNAYGELNVSSWTNIKAVAAGTYHIVGLKEDGTVVTAGWFPYGELDPASWTNIRSIAAGGWNTVGLKADGTIVAAGNNQQGMISFGSWNTLTAVAAGLKHTVGLKADGTAVAVGGGNNNHLLDVSAWTDLTSIAAAEYSTVGLKSDGTVLALGYGGYGHLDVSSWTNITAIAAGPQLTAGLKADGTVVAVGNNTYGQVNVYWSNIKAIAVGATHTVGLKQDGTVVAMGGYGYGQLNVSSWTNIKAIAAGQYHTVGLKEDGTVVAVGHNTYGQLNVSSWTNIKAIAAGQYHTVGLKEDGTVVAVGYNAYGQLDVSSWTAITAIGAGYHHTIGVKADGTAVAVGHNAYSQLNLHLWDNIKQPMCDATPPVTVSTITGTPGTYGWYVTDVQAALTATDNEGGSGINEIHYTIDGIETIVSGSSSSEAIQGDGSHPFTYYAIDIAGNAETLHPLAINIDKTAPTITVSAAPSANGNGWNNSDVSVSVTCNDATSGIESCTDSVTVAAEGANQVISGTVVDFAGHAASASVTLNIDKTPPAIAITGVSDNASYTVGAVPTPGNSVSDNLSGLNSQNAVLTGGNANNVGTFTYTVSASDYAGNTSVATAIYDVMYSFGGYLNLNASYRLGSSINLKFQLTDASGTYISTASGTISVQQYLDNQPVGNSIFRGTVRYDAESNQYLYRMNTSDLFVGTWQIQAQLDDGTVRTAFIDITP